MRRAALWTLRIGIAAAVLAWVFYAADWREVGSAIARVPAGAVAIALALYGAATLIGSLRLQLLLRAQGADCSFGFAFQLTYIGLFCNLALPGGNGGDVVKIGWASRVTGSVAKAIAAAGMDRGVGLVSLTLFAAAPAVAAINVPAYRLPGVVCGAVLAGVIGAAALYFLPPVRRLFERSHGAQGRIAHALGTLDQAIVSYKRRPKVLLAAVALSVAGQAAVIGSIGALGVGLGLVGVNYFLVIPAVLIILAIPLAPGGVGQAEWAFAELLTAEGIGVPAAQALALAVCVRFILVAFGVSGGIVLAFARAGGSTTPAGGEAPEPVRATVDTAEPAPDSSAR